MENFYYIHTLTISGDHFLLETLEKSLTRFPQLFDKRQVENVLYTTGVDFSFNFSEEEIEPLQQGYTEDGKLYYHFRSLNNKFHAHLILFSSYCPRLQFEYSYSMIPIDRHNLTKWTFSAGHYEEQNNLLDAGKFLTPEKDEDEATLQNIKEYFTYFQ